jgi:hypothetical protein
MTGLYDRWWGGLTRQQRLLRVVQPALIGLIVGTVSPLAPVLFAVAIYGGTKAGLLVGLAASLGAAISMGLSEALSDDGKLTGRGGAVTRGFITGASTFVGGFFHFLPLLIPDLKTALKICFIAVGIELVAIAFIRRAFLNVSLRQSLIQVTLAGVIVTAVGVALWFS